MNMKMAEQNGMWSWWTTVEEDSATWRWNESAWLCSWLGEPWSVLKWKWWLLFPARGLEGWLQWVQRRGEEGSKEPRNTNGPWDWGVVWNNYALSQLALGHSNVFRGLKLSPWDGDQKRKRCMLGSPSFSHSTPASLLSPQPRHLYANTRSISIDLGM